MHKPIVFDLDDFCEEIMKPEFWGLLFTLRDIYPRLKITMFTVPLKCSESWLRRVTEDYDWLELHYHGSDHEDRHEWLNKIHVDFPFGEFFYKGFKAPWWRMGQRTADVFNDKGFVLSSMAGYFDVNGPKIYRFNSGREIIPSVQYEGSRYCTMHSHVQPMKMGDGLPQIFDKVAHAYPRDSEFVFISELFEGGENEVGVGGNNI